MNKNGATNNTYNQIASSIKPMVDHHNNEEMESIRELSKRLRAIKRKLLLRHVVPVTIDTTTTNKQHHLDGGGVSSLNIINKDVKC